MVWASGFQLGAWVLGLGFDHHGRGGGVAGVLPSIQKVCHLFTLFHVARCLGIAYTNSLPVVLIWQASRVRGSGFGVRGCVVWPAGGWWLVGQGRAGGEKIKPRSGATNNRMDDKATPGMSEPNCAA
jgi:hypothetical protein